MTLDELMIHYGSDKSSLGHAYTQYYEMFFEPIRHNHLSLLEIGIWEGASLKAWKDYFENGGVNGIDLQDNYPELNQLGIKTFVLDQSSDNQLKQFSENYPNCFTIICDDGSHVGSDQIKTFDYLWNCLQPGGYYCCEDLLCGYDERWNKNGRFYDRVRKMIGEVSMNGKMSNNHICANKQQEIVKYLQTLNTFEREIEFFHQSAGLCIIKKILV